MVEPLPAPDPVIPPIIVPIVHVNVLLILEVNPIEVATPLQLTDVVLLVTTGAACTVLVIVTGEPTQVPDVEVGVTMYCTLPSVVLLGSVSVWAMVEPLPAPDPVIPPLIVPIVHANVLPALEVSPMLVATPLQLACVAGVVTTGVGCTVFVIVTAEPAQLPDVDVGVTMYCTLPSVVLFGFVNTSLIVPMQPELHGLAPVMDPVIAPTVQVKLLPALEVSPIFSATPLQLACVDGVVITGVGCTVFVIVTAEPTHAPDVEVGVTMYCTLPSVLLLGLISV
jgi:hypothetical protein